MKLQRRYQKLPPHWYCMNPACHDEYGACGFGPASEAEARRHVEHAGHEVRVFTGATTILRPAGLAVTGS